MADRNPNTTPPKAQPPDPLLAYHQGLAAQARRHLARLGCYPTRDIAADPDNDYYERNIRANLLPAALARLNRCDLVALYELAELLAAHPRDPAFFAWYQREQRATLATYVQAGLIPTHVLDPLDL